MPGQCDISYKLKYHFVQVLGKNCLWHYKKFPIIYIALNTYTLAPYLGMALYNRFVPTGSNITIF